MSDWGKRPTWELRNIRQALTYFQALNTPEENARLAEVKAELRRRARREK